MSSVPPTVYRGSTRPVVWRFWADADETVPRTVPSGSVAVMRLARDATTLTRRSDELDGLKFWTGEDALPAAVEWTPTLGGGR